jgi:hypothetical protein
MDTEEARRILETESQARLDLKQARASIFLELVRKGVKTTEAWQQVALDTSEFERIYEDAHNERALLWLQAGMAQPPELDGAGT